MFDFLVVGIFSAWTLVVICFGFAMLMGAGWLLTFYGLRLEREADRWLGVLVCGTALASVWLNAIGKLTGSWEFAVWSFVLFGAGGAWDLWHHGMVRFPIRTWWKRQHTIMLGAMLLIAGLGFIGGAWDEVGHFPFISLVASGNWPAQFWFNPQLALSYHYGYDLVVAWFVTFGAYVSPTSDVLQAVLQATLAALVYRLARTFGCTPKRAAVVAMLALFAASAAWLIRPFRPWLPESFATVFPFHSSLMANSLFLTAYMKSWLIAGTSLLFVWLVIRTAPYAFRGLRGGMVVFLLLLAAALSSETILVVFAPVLCIAYLLRRDTTFPLAARVAVLACAAIGIALQGGLLSDLVATFFGAGGEGRRVSTGLLVEPRLWHETFIFPINLASWEGLLRLVLELAGFLVLAGFAFWKSRSFPVFERWLLVCSAFAFAIPFFVHYAVQDRELLRMWLGGFLVTNTLGAIVLVSRVTRTWVLAGAVTVLVVGGVASTLLTNIPLNWLGQRDPTIVSRALWIPYLRHETRLAPGSVIWTDAPPVPREIIPEFRQLTLVFGAYAQTCQNVFTHVVHTACEAFRSAPSTETLAALGATHLLLRDTFVERYQDEPWFSRLELVAVYPDAPSGRLGFIPLSGTGEQLSLFAVLPNSP